MDTRQINTAIGAISVRIRTVEGSIPIIFLHGVYYDHNLWNSQVAKISDRTVVTVDMPFHGESKNITKYKWSMDDCACMLIEILDALKFNRAIAIGHSWGSMTILRAAVKAPERFKAIGLCNMPFQAATPRAKVLFRVQHLLLGFRKFYSRQVAKTLYGGEIYAGNPQLLSILESSMSKLSNAEIRQTDRSVIIQAEDTEPIIRSITVPALALKGKEDYVPQSEYLNTRIVAGGHVSPIEVPEDVYSFVMDVVNMK